MKKFRNFDELTTQEQEELETQGVFTG